METKFKKSTDKETKKEGIELVVTEPEEFVSTMNSMYTTFDKLTESINSLFSIFSDFCGAKINLSNTEQVVNNSLNLPGGLLYVDLYFRDMGKEAPGTIKNIQPAGQRSKDEDLLDRIRRVGSPNINSRAYRVTKDTYSVLEPFTFEALSGRKANWNARTRETQELVGGPVFGREGICVIISGLSLDAILSKIYGTKDEDGRYAYAASLIRYNPYSYNGMIDADKSLVCVHRLNDNEVRKLVNEANVGNSGNVKFFR